MGVVWLMTSSLMSASGRRSFGRDGLAQPHHASVRLLLVLLTGLNQRALLFADGLEVTDADEMSGAVDFALHLGVLLGREPGSVGVHDLQHERSSLGQHAHVDVLSARRRKSHLLCLEVFVERTGDELLHGRL